MEYYLAIAYQKVTEAVAVMDREIRKFCQIIADGYQPPVYVFLQGFSVPFRTSQIQLDAVGTPPIHWYYDPKFKYFYTAGLSEQGQRQPYRRLPWLTVEIKHEDRTVHDCSDFVNDIRWRGPEGRAHPSFEEILAAWTLESGVVLGHHPDFVVECINEEGDSVQHRLAPSVAGAARPV